MAWRWPSAGHGCSPNALIDPAPIAATGVTRLFVLRDGVLVGALSLADEIRPESAQAVGACIVGASGWP